LDDGKIRFQSKLEAEEELATLYVMRGDNEYIVVANQPIDDAPAGATVQPVPGGYGPQGQYSPLVKGRVYALNKNDGEMLWPTPATIEHFGLPLDQPTQLPMVAFMRNVSTDSGSPSRTWKTEIVCLDKRDGRIAFHQREIQGNTQVYRIEGDPDAQSVAIMLPGESFTLQWTDQPRPPEPPAQLSSEAESDIESK
jgi:outer membrane protein assembly factor BamB